MLWWPHNRGGESGSNKKGSCRAISQFYKRRIDQIEIGCEILEERTEQKSYLNRSKRCNIPRWPLSGELLTNLPNLSPVSTLSLWWFFLSLELASSTSPSSEPLFCYQFRTNSSSQGLHTSESMHKWKYIFQQRDTPRRGGRLWGKKSFVIHFISRFAPSFHHILKSRKTFRFI